MERQRQGGSDVGSTAGKGDRPRNTGRRGALPRSVAVAVASAGGMRQAACGTVDIERELVGGLDGERIRGQERPREEAQVHGQGDEHHRGPAGLPGDGRRQDRRRTRGLGQHPRPVQQEVRDEQVGRPGRRQRNAGIIGWYIPRYLLKQYPQFKTWKGLKGKEGVFKTPESSPNAGTFLGGDPSYVQKDRALIKELGLNLKHVVSGAEPAQVARWTKLYKQQKPVIFYWYDPQYLNAIYDLYRVQLRSGSRAASTTRRRRETTRASTRGYPTLDKLVSSKFAKSGSPALKVVRNSVDVGRPELRHPTSSRGSTWTRTRPPQCGWRRTRPRSRPG